MKSKIIMIILASVLLCALISGCTVSRTKELKDAPKGYSVSVPVDMTFDFTLAKSYTKCINSDMEIFISRETSPYDDVLYYINNYYDRYIISPEYQKKNNISLNWHTIEKIKNRKVKFVTITRTPYESSEVKLNTYSYVYILNEGSRDFFRLMIKSAGFDKNEVLKLAESFKEIPVAGVPENSIDMKPVPLNWNSETRQFYESLCNRQDVMWGIFIPDAVSPEGMNNSISDLETKLDYKFGLCMQYSHIPHDSPPLKGLREAYADGKITELTIQTATFWNNDIGKSVNPNLEIIDGARDEEIRAYARAVKEFEHPVILRINNEMNTDWTSYAGIQLLEDPEIYKQVYNRIFDIFIQEGVDNAIWQFNPQLGDFPPANFNNYMSYFPGADKVQVLGITAYNSGNYYKETDGDNWKSFENMYDEAQALYMRNFADWPWIIGEFGSDSHGGSKENWITNMFNKIGDYKNIKAAIWLNWEAYDARKGSFGTAAHCYRLDETQSTLRAFKDGLHGIQTKEKLIER